MHRIIRLPVSLSIACYITFSLLVCLPANAQLPLSADLKRSPCLTFDLLRKSENPSELDKKHPAYADLGWTTSAFWVGSGELVFSDNAFNQLAKASLDQCPSKAGLVEKAPVIESEDGPYYLKYAYPLPDGAGFVMFAYRHDARAGDLVLVGPDFKVRRTISLDGLGDGALKVTMLYRFAPVGDGILAYADLTARQPEKKEEHFRSFILIGFDGSYKHIGDPVAGWSNLHYRSVRDFPFITSMGDTGYVLVMEDEAWVARVSWDEPQLERLATDAAITSKYAKLAPVDWFYDPKEVMKGTQVVPRSIKMNQLYQFYRDVERSTMLAGIHVWQGRLFLLAREAASEEKAHWRLLEVESSTGKLSAEHRLPTEAPNVLLAPGEDFLGIVEKSATGKITSPPAFKLAREALTVKRVRRTLLTAQPAAVDDPYCKHVAPAAD